jgi:hypothetical protein
VAGDAGKEDGKSDILDCFFLPKGSPRLSSPFSVPTRLKPRQLGVANRVQSVPPPPQCPGWRRTRLDHVSAVTLPPRPDNPFRTVRLNSSRQRASIPSTSRRVRSRRGAAKDPQRLLAPRRCSARSRSLGPQHRDLPRRPPGHAGPGGRPCQGFVRPDPAWPEADAAPRGAPGRRPQRLPPGPAGDRPPPVGRLGEGRLTPRGNAPMNPPEKAKATRQCSQPFQRVLHADQRN